MKYRVYLSPRLGPGNLPLPQAIVNAGIRTGFGDEWIRFGRIKFSLDGSASGRTMRISEPYVGRPGDHGILYMDQQELNEGVEWAHRHGCQAEIHANGDVAIDMAMQAYERVERQWPRAGGVPARHQIEHCSLVNPSLLRRIAALGVIPSAFTTYIYYHGEKWAEYGQERMEWMFAKRAFLDHGIKVSAGSDYVPGPFEPLMGIQSMVTRTDYEGRVWGGSQRVSVEEAIRISTVHGAWASFEEDLKGSVKAGMLADFVVLGQDPYQVDPMTIKDIPVVRTVIGGRTVHEA
jgi:predicted amidohydrolase YtcJ